MLDRFRHAKQAEISRLEALASKGAMAPVFTGNRPPFAASLRAMPVPVIAEYKRASPSKGDINLGLSPEDVAAAYADAGAGALSVLTEETYFKGDLAFLSRMTGPGLPLLRKDFILHPLQVEHSAATPASAILLIVRMLDDAMLRELIRRSLRLGLEPVTEIFDETDLLRARTAEAPIIQVNSRDLDTLRVDATLPHRLVSRKLPSEFWVAASGIDRRETLLTLLNAGFDAALVGSALMSGREPGEALRLLIGKGEGRD